MEVELLVFIGLCGNIFVICGNIFVMFGNIFVMNVMIVYSK